MFRRKVAGSADPNSRIMKQNEEDQLVKFSVLPSICSSGFAQL